jgi:serine/threonine-protein kinase
LHGALQFTKMEQIGLARRSFFAGSINKGRTASMAERQLGPFLLGKKLGVGGMGVVYRATYSKTGQVVALKLLSKELSIKPRLVARFERELAILKKLKHPNIVPCYGGGKLGEQHFLAMELIEGGTLATELKRRSKMSWEEVITVGLQICSALEHAHEHGIIHRDLKPSNLLRTTDGKLKLADFGIARDVDATALTAAGKTVGTFAYMAPEQIRGDPPVTAKTDLYALGCVLYELLTGAPPFAAETAGELLYLHIEKKPVRVSTFALDCPVWLDTLVQQLLEKEPEKRPRDASAVSLALTEIEVKVAEQASVLTHAASGMPTNLNVTGDTNQVRSLLKSKKKKRRDTSPIYERTWFLSMCLVLVLGFIAWSLWPPNEDQLLRKATTLMETDEPANWAIARKDYLSKLQTRFPDGESAALVQQYIDKIDMHDAEEKLKYKTRWGKEPATEGERLYAQARQYELFGDRVTALEKYESMIQVLGDGSEARPYVNLAKRQKAQIESSGDARLDRLEIVAKAMQSADKAYRDGKVVEANQIWKSIIALYGENKELRPQVRKARARLADKEDPDAEPEVNDAAVE